MPNPYFGIIPRSSSLGDPTIPVAQLLKPYPAVHDRQPLSQQRRHDASTTGSTAKLEQRFSHGLSYLVSYTRSRLMDDASSVFDASILTGPVANYPVADSFNRRLERDYSTGDIPHVFVASAVWDLPVGAGRAHQPGGVVGALANDWTLTGIVTLQSGIPIAVTQTTNFNAFAGFGTQRPNLVGDPELPADERTVSALVQHRGVRRPRRSSRSAAPRAIRCAGPAIRNVDLALSRRVPLAPALRSSCAPRRSTSPTRRRSAHRTASFGSAAFGTITTAGDPRVIQLAAKFLF